MTRFLQDTYRILEATEPAEYAALSDAGKSIYNLIISAGTVDYADGTKAKTLLWSLFGEETTTRENLEALEKPEHIPSP